MFCDKWSQGTVIARAMEGRVPQKIVYAYRTYQFDVNWFDVSWIDLNGCDLVWVDLNWAELNGCDLSCVELIWIELQWVESTLGQPKVGLNFPRADFGWWCLALSMWGQLLAGPGWPYLAMDLQAGQGQQCPHPQSLALAIQPHWKPRKWAPLAWSPTHLRDVLLLGTW